MTALLLDTHTAIWLAEGIELEEAILAEIVAAGLKGEVYVSPISAWEIGMLATRQNPAKARRFEPDPKRWFADLMALPGIKSAHFNDDIAIAASYLPDPFHSDPADRILVATARHMDIPIVTRDRLILDYGKAGHVKKLAC